MARKKNRHASSDSLSDYDHKVYDSDDNVESKPEKPKSFEELLAVANQKDEENKKELELRKQVRIFRSFNKSKIVKCSNMTYNESHAIIFNFYLFRRNRECNNREKRKKQKEKN